MHRPLSLTLLLFLFVSPLLPQSAAPTPPEERPSQTSAEPEKISTSPAPAASTATRSGDSTHLEAIEAPDPVYPSEAKTGRIQGQVWVKLLISETGDVEGVNVISGDPILASAAVEAFKKWRFKPYIRNGQAVKASVKLPMDFSPRSEVKNELITLKPGDASGPKRIRVSQAITEGIKLKSVAPIYPKKARQAGVQGTVLLSAVIGRDGRIAGIKVLSGPELLVPAAIKAVLQWRYKPYIMNNEPVEVDTQITVNFTLNQ